MTKRTNAYPDLERDLQFYPLGINEPIRLNRSQIDKYNTKGYLFPIKIFNESEIIFSNQIRELNKMNCLNQKIYSESEI